MEAEAAGLLKSVVGVRQQKTHDVPVKLLHATGMVLSPALLLFFAPFLEMSVPVIISLFSCCLLSCLSMHTASSPPPSYLVSLMYCFQNFRSPPTLPLKLKPS